MFKRFRLFIALFWAEFHERCAFWRLQQTLDAAGADGVMRNVAHCQPKMDDRDQTLLAAKIVLSKKGKVTRKINRPRPIRVTEALSMNEKRDALRMALQEKFRDAYICDFYDDYVIYELWDVDQKERLFKAEYTMSDEGAVTLSDGVEVRREVNYEPLKNAPELVLPNYGALAVMESAQEFIPICEAAKSKLGSGEALVKVLAPGWNFNSSIYYPADVIKRDIASALPDGTKCFADHRPSVNGKRPEGSIDRVAGVITGGAFWMENGPDGPGGYANVRLTETWKPTLVALKDDIGTSIDLDATPSYGTVEGKSGIIIKRLYNTGLGSLDFVTKPGAGGKFISIQEAAQEVAPEHTTKENTVTPEEKAALEAENARLKAQIAATQRVTEAVQEIGAQLPATLPALTRQRLIRTISESAPACEDGTLDKEALTVRVTEAVTEAQAELAEVAGNPVRGMGASTAVRVTEGAQENGNNNDGAKFDASNIIGC